MAIAVIMAVETETDSSSDSGCDDDNGLRRISHERAEKCDS